MKKKSYKGSPLQIAFKKGYIDIFNFLLDNGANPNELYKSYQTILHKACINNNTEVIDSLISHGANVNYPYNGGITPLHCAAAFSIHGADYLLLAKANIDSKTIEGITPLHVACIYKNFQVIKLLIQNGADINSLSNVHFIFI